MTVKDRVTEAILRAINEVNQQLPRDRQLADSTSTRLSGEAAQLDSLGVTLLLVTSEQHLELEFNTPIELTTDDVLSDPTGPLSSVGSLIDYICKMLEGKGNGARQP